MASTPSSEGTPQLSECSLEDQEKDASSIQTLIQNEHPALTKANLSIHLSLLPPSSHSRVERAIQFVDRQSHLVQLEKDLQKELAKERQKARKSENMHRDKTIQRAVMDRLIHPFQSSTPSPADTDATLIAIGYHQYLH